MATTSFRTGLDHFDGANNLISFRTCEKDGRIYLEQTAWAPNSGLFNAVVGAHFAKSQSWVAQAEICEKQSSKLIQFYNLALTDESVHVQT
jgi:hypothetical protein